MGFGIIISSLLLFNSVLSHGYSIGNTVTEHPKPNRICKTSGCIEAAKFISKNINVTVNPCDNFYQFACGKYIDEQIFEDDASEMSISNEAFRNIQNKLRRDIEDKIEKNDPRTFQLLKSHYNVCLNAGKLEKNSTQKLLDILNKLNGWPVIDGKSWNESIFNWQNSVYKLRQMGFVNSMNSFLNFDIDIDKKNNTKYVISLDHPEIELEQQYLTNSLENDGIRGFLKYIVNLAEMLGADRHQAEKELAESLTFEIELAKISTVEGENNETLMTYMTVEELQSNYSYINWKEYLNEFLRPWHHIELSEKVIVYDPIYFQRLSELISKTPKRTLANYIILQVVLESIRFMNEQFLNVRAEFAAMFTGMRTRYPRWKTCIKYVSDNLPLAVGALYVRKNFDKNLKSSVKEIVDYVRESFKTLLEKVDWMDEKTKISALKKIEAVYAHVAYPDELLNDDTLNEYFKNLKEFPSSYLDSYLSINLFEFDYDLQQFRKPINKTDWVRHGTVAEFNAYYYREENSILINAGYLPKEFFSTDRPNYMNYGTIGSIIGHELTHGFDVAGSQYNDEGNLMDWWNPRTHTKYLKRTQCLIDQYNNYTVAELGLNVNGLNTLGENIADNGGIKQAYFAYEKYERRNGPEPYLPELSYTPRQLFWISAANMWCSKIRPETVMHDMIFDEHCPEEFRVIGPFSNMPEFSRDFNCPIGSPMNPINKCSVW